MATSVTDRLRTKTAALSGLDVAVYRIPTEDVESDGTFTWDSTTLGIARVHAAGQSGFGYTYADASTGRLIEDVLADAIVGLDPFDVPLIWTRMVQRIRNLGRPGISSMAIAAVDSAVWDLKARLLDLPSHVSSVRCGIGCRCMAAADSRPIPSNGCRGSSTNGSHEGFGWSQ